MKIVVQANNPYGGNLAYYWRATNGMLSLSRGNMVEWTAPDVPGTYTIEVIVNDGNGGAASGEVSITVKDTSV